MIIGVTYHPEHSPPERWREDARLMKEMGLNAVRMGEFAWSHLEPVRNKFRFRWLEEAVAVFAEHGIGTVLCTPTACPPPWLVERHPGLLPVDASGQRLGYGTCRSYCPNNPSQHKYAQRITAALAAHFRGNRNILAWQVDSGFGRFGTARCYCRNCAQGFREWLQRKYTTLENLNQRWGTVFWSHVYSDWQQIPLPARAVGEGELAHNPALWLDYCRFCSDSWVRYQHLLVETLRRECPGVLVTHNLAASVTEIDPFKLAGDLDFLSISLRNGQRGYGADHRLLLDLAQASKGRTFWAMDVDEAATVSTITDYQQMVTLGAEALFFSRWRPAPFGAEQLRPGLLNHDGRPGILFETAANVAHKIAKENPPHQSNAKIASIISHESAWALSMNPEPNVNYWEHVGQLHTRLLMFTPSVCVTNPNATLAPFRLVVAPMLFVMPQDLAKRLSQYVANGGDMVMTCMSSIKDAENNVWTHGLPGGMQEVLGLTLKGFTTGASTLYVESEGRSFRAHQWLDMIELRGAKALAVHADGPLKGLPAVTVNVHGKGRAYYLGACGGAEFYDYFISLACQEAGLAAKSATS